MSNEYFFGDEDFLNSAFIAGLDAFEVEHNIQPDNRPQNPLRHLPRGASPRPPPSITSCTRSCPKSPLAGVIIISDDDEYKLHDFFDLKNANWEEFSRTSSGKLQQHTLWGVRAPPDNRHKLPPRQKGKSIKKTKTWNRTEYARSG